MRVDQPTWSRSSVALVFLAVAACRSGNPAPAVLGQLCVSNEECPPAAVCHWGYCRPSCDVDSDCPDANDGCIEGACEPVGSPECRVAADCRAPTACQDPAGARCIGRRCQYNMMEAGAACDDGDRCTDDDTCSTAGICGGVALACDVAGADACLCDLSGDPAGSRRGYCATGRCVECRTPDECTEPAGGPLVCFAATCPSDRCVYTPKPGELCQTHHCENGVAFELTTCTVTGACPGVGGHSCNGFRCDAGGIECLTLCTAGGDCMPDFFCRGDFVCASTRADGAPCADDGAAACRSGYCDGARCCAGGSCCNAPGDCPPALSAVSACQDFSPATTCQGERVDATCVDHVCGTETVADDSGCGGLHHACANGIAQVTCSGVVDAVAPVCASTCTDALGCAKGYVCQGTSCGVPLGAGLSCTGTGQGSCSVGLICDNGFCCSSRAAHCCGPPTQCPNGLGCDTPAFVCYDVCNDDDSSRCANAATYCLDDVCVAKLATGAVCRETAECLTGVCACSDAACVVKRCAAG
jgi:hypothetical protein